MTPRRVVLYATTGAALTWIAICAVILRLAVAADVIHGSHDRTQAPRSVR